MTHRKVQPPLPNGGGAEASVKFLIALAVAVLVLGILTGLAYAIG